MFSTPIPGQSLTKEPRAYPWEDPPKYSNPEDALIWHIDRLEKPERTNKLISKTVYFKEPTNITSFPVKLLSNLTNEEIVVYYAKDNYSKDRFMNTKKFEYAYKTGDWSFS